MAPGRRLPAVGWILGICLFLALILLVERSVGWRTILAPWKAVPLAPLAAAFSLVLASYALRAVRVHRLFMPDTAGHFRRSFRLILLHNLFNNLLPMRSGEASFPLLMKREFGVPFSRSIPGLFYLRILDFHLLLILGAAVLSWNHGGIASAAVALLLPLPLFAYLLQERARPALEGSTSRLGRAIHRGMEGLPGTASVFWWTWLWTLVNWATKLLVFAWILGTFALVPFGTALLGSVTGEVSSVLPVHGLAGAGTYEAGVAAGLLTLGVEPEAALRGGVNLHLFVLGASILSGALALLVPVRPRTPPDQRPRVWTHPGEGPGVS